MSGVIALVDPDRVYITRLMEYINRSKRTELRCVAFTEEEAFVDYMSTHPVTCLLAGGGLCTEKRYRVRYQFLLTEEPETAVDGQMIVGMDESGSLGNFFACFFRYQSADDLLAAVCRQMAQETQAVRTTERGAERQVIGVFSLAQSDEISGYACRLSQESAGSGKALLLGFDPFYRYTEENRIQQALSEALYLCTGRRDVSDERLRALLSQRDQTDILWGVAHWSDIAQTGREDALYMLQKLLSFEAYTAVVIDFGPLCEASCGLLSACTEIREFLGDDNQTRYEAWRRQLVQQNDVTITDRIRTVTTADIRKGERNDGKHQRIA